MHSPQRVAEQNDILVKPMFVFCNVGFEPTRPVAQERVAPKLLSEDRCTILTALLLGRLVKARFGPSYGVDLNKERA